MYKKYPHKIEIEAADIMSMSTMSPDEYEIYLRSDGDGLVWVDHHDVLRSGIAGYPIATNKSQLRAYIAYLQELEERVGKE